jgi:uncharacterized membrane protein HdeD (DUF308 family)
VWILGVLLVSSGIVQAIHEIRSSRSTGKTSRMLLSALAIIAGILVMRNPLAGTEGVTLVMAFYFLAAGVGKGVLAHDAQPVPGWGWLLLSSMASLLMGFFLIASFPAVSLWVPGIFFGVDLIFYGTSLIALGMALRRLKAEMPMPTDEKRAA